MSSHMALLSIEMATVDAAQDLAKIKYQLPQEVFIKTSSSIYKRYLSRAFQDLNSTVFMVLKVETEFGFEKLFDEMKRTNLFWKILVFDQIVRISPNLTLPSPALNEDPALLRCAAEAWPEYRHPILGQSLNELVKSVHSFDDVEFHAQGKEIL